MASRKYFGDFSTVEDSPTPALRSTPRTRPTNREECKGLFTIWKKSEEAYKNMNKDGSGVLPEVVAIARADYKRAERDYMINCRGNRPLITREKRQTFTGVTGGKRKTRKSRGRGARRSRKVGGTRRRGRKVSGTRRAGRKSGGRSTRRRR